MVERTSDGREYKALARIPADWPAPRQTHQDRQRDLIGFLNDREPFTTHRRIEVNGVRYHDVGPYRSLRNTTRKQWQERFAGRTVWLRFTVMKDQR